MSDTTSSLALDHPYAFVDREISTHDREGEQFSQTLATEPSVLASASEGTALARLRVLRDFQRRCVELFRASIAGDADPLVRDWLLNDLPSSLRLGFHRRLEDRHFSLPMFFRTDEGHAGKVLELQAPGSLWGDLEVIWRLWNASTSHVSAADRPSERFIRALDSALPGVTTIHHLLDNASGRAGMEYFIRVTMHRFRYYGYSSGVKIEDCQFIRSHSFYGLCGENLFASRLARAGRQVFYDLPPYSLFDQKACLVLPFWSLTRDLFTDEMRELFSFSAPVLPTGIETPEGDVVSIDDFCARSRGDRNYYLKYAGVDTNLNWGSRAVFRLSNYSHERCRQALVGAAAGSGRRRIWMIQADQPVHADIGYIARDGRRAVARGVNGKYSCFYGPDDFIGAIAQYRHFNKVHGQADTIVSPLCGP